MTMYRVKTASGNIYWIDGDTNEWTLDHKVTAKETRGAGKGILVGPKPPREGERLLLQWPDPEVGGFRLARTAPVTMVDAINDDPGEEVLA